MRGKMNTKISGGGGCKKHRCAEGRIKERWVSGRKDGGWVYE